MSVADPVDAREIVVSRLLDAPRDLAFKAWTDRRHVAEWWGPNGFTTTVSEMDVRPGGVWQFVMHGPDGTDYPNHIVFHEVVEPERLVFTHGSGPQDAQSFDVTITFADEGGKTRITLRQLYPTAEARDFVAREFHAVEMGNQSLNRFAEYLATHRS